MKREIFQIYVYNNFHIVKSGLNQGIFDRKNFWLSRLKDSSHLYGPCLGAAEEFVSGKTFCTRGNIYFTKDKERGKTTYWICESLSGSDSLSSCCELIETNMIKYGENKSLENRGEYWRKNNVKFYKYTSDGKEKYVVSRNDFHNKRETAFFVTDHFLGFGATDEQIWDSFYTFFAIIDFASREENWNAADEDFAETVRLLNGEDANPLRFVVSLGDQHLQYIFSAFGFEGDSKFQDFFSKLRKDKPGSNFVGYSDRIAYIEKLIDNASLNPKEKKMAHNTLSLIYAKKSDRNVESHLQRRLEDPMGMMRDYINDHVMVIYLIKHVLKQNLKIGDADIISSKLYTPLESKDAATLKVEPNASYNEGGEEIFVKPFMEYSVRRDGATDTINITIKELKKSSWTIVNDSERGLYLQPGPDLCTDKKLKIDYDAYFIDIFERLGSLEKKAISREEGTKIATESASKVMGEWSENYKALLTRMQKDKADVVDRLNNTKNRIDGVEIELKKKYKHVNWKVNSVILVIILLVLIVFSLFYCANNLSLATEWDFAYKLSSKFFGMKSSLKDVPFERALYLENKLAEDTRRHYEANDVNINDYVFSESSNNRRKEIAKCYRDAENKYSQISEDGEALYRLANMYALGKGGKIDLNQALEYAQQAALKRDHSAGFIGVLKILNRDFSRSYINRMEKEIGMDPADEYAELARAMCNLEKYALNMSDDYAAIPKHLKAIDSIASHSYGFVREMAYYVMAQYMLAGIKEENGYILHKNVVSGLSILQEQAMILNSLLAQLHLADIMRFIIREEEGTEMNILAFYNGRNESGIFAIENLMNAGWPTERIYKKWPELEPKYMKTSGSGVFRIIEKAKQYYADEDYESAYELVQKAEATVKKFYPELHLKNYDITMANIEIRIPEKADSLLARLLTMKPKTDVAFFKDVDEATKSSAVYDYVRAYLAAEGLGGNEPDKALADSLLSSASGKGMARAQLTQMIRKYKSSPTHSDFTLEIIPDIYKAKGCPDQTKIWLAERTRFTRPDLSMDIVRSISDTLNLYRIFREIDYADTRSMIDTVQRDYGALSIRLYDAFDPYDASFLPYSSAYMAFLARFEATKQSSLLTVMQLANNSFLANASNGVFIQPLIYATIAIREESNKRGDKGGDTEQLQKYLDFLHQLFGNKDEFSIRSYSYPKYLMSNIDYMLDNLHTLRPPYPNRVWAAYAPEIPEFEPIANLYDL